MPVIGEVGSRLQVTWRAVRWNGMKCAAGKRSAEEILFHTNEMGCPSSLEMADTNRHDCLSTLPSQADLAVTENVSTSGTGFESVLMENLEEVNRLQGEADQQVQRLLTGDGESVVDVLAAVNKAGDAYDLLMQIRNQLTEAYQEIQQMRV